MKKFIMDSIISGNYNYTLIGLDTMNRLVYFENHRYTDSGINLCYRTSDNSFDYIEINGCNNLFDLLESIHTSTGKFNDNFNKLFPINVFTNERFDWLDSCIEDYLKVKNLCLPTIDEYCNSHDIDFDSSSLSDYAESSILDEFYCLDDGGDYLREFYEEYNVSEDDECYDWLKDDNIEIVTVEDVLGGGSDE